MQEKLFKSQAGIEATTLFSLLIILLILSFFIYLNESSIINRQTNFLQAQRAVQETATLINTGNRVEGFYGEFQVPLIPSTRFYVFLNNYSVTGFLDVPGGQTQIPFPINATIYCSNCTLWQGNYWVSTSNKITRVGRKS